MRSRTRNMACHNIHLSRGVPVVDAKGDLSSEDPVIFSSMPKSTGVGGCRLQDSHEGTLFLTIFA